MIDTENIFIAENYTHFVQDYVMQKKTLTALEAKVSKMKKELSDLVDEYGTPDDSGHRWLNVGTYELKRERRVSKSFDVSAAEMWARSKGLWDAVKEVIPEHEVLSEDKLVGYAWKHKEFATDVQGFYTEKETWAFKA